MNEEGKGDDSQSNEVNVVKYQSQTQAGGDWFLQYLVWQVNTYGIELPITLNVGGLIITGKAIKGAKYFEEFARQFKSGFTNEAQSLGETLGRRISELAFDYPMFEIEPDSTQENPLHNVENVHYIHVRNAKFYSESGNNMKLNNQLILWRGRLESIDGFFLGERSE